MNQKHIKKVEAKLAAGLEIQAFILERSRTLRTNVQYMEAKYPGTQMTEERLERCAGWSRQAEAFDYIGEEIVAEHNRLWQEKLDDHQLDQQALGAAATYTRAVVLKSTIPESMVTTQWNDDKAMQVVEVIRKRQPGWTVHHEFQACISVDTGGLNDPTFWFGDANRTLGGDVYENDKAHSSGEILQSVDTMLDADKTSIEELARALIVKVYLVCGTVRRIRQTGGWVGRKSVHLEVELTLEPFREFMQSCEEIWSPVGEGSDYTSVMLVTAKAATAIAQDAMTRVQVVHARNQSQSATE